MSIIDTSAVTEIQELPKNYPELRMPEFPLPSGLLADHEIEALCCADEPMLTPFFNHLVREENEKKVISYGLSSYGYDLRLDNKFKIFTNALCTQVDPKAFDKRAFVEFEGDVCVIPPNSFVLGSSIEKFNMPRDVTGIVLGKSTYARVGIV